MFFRRLINTTDITKVDVWKVVNMVNVNQRLELGRVKENTCFIPDSLFEDSTIHPLFRKHLSVTYF